VSAGLKLSDTWKTTPLLNAEPTVPDKVALVVGLFAVRVSPEGNPVADQTKGVLYPVAFNVVLYGTATTPCESEVVVIARLEVVFSDTVTDARFPMLSVAEIITG